MNQLEIARQRVIKSRWIPIYLLGLLLAYGCTVTRESRSVADNTPAPTIFQVK